MQRSRIAALAALSLVLGATVPAGAHGQGGAPRATEEPAAEVTAAATAEVATERHVLVYGPTAGGYAETTPGVQATVWDEAAWAAATTAEFATFDAIVFADQPACSVDQSRWSTAVGNRQVWGAALTGNVILNATDPDWHGKERFVHQAVAFAAAGDEPGPGLYVSLGCAHQVGPPVTVDLLGALGHFTVQGVNNCPNLIHKIAAHPTLDGLSDEYLSNWQCSSHGIFGEWPDTFQPLVLAADAAPSPAPPRSIAPDGTSGHAFVLARGQAFFCDDAEDADGDCLPDPVEAQVGTDATVADTDGDGLDDSWEVDPGVQGAGIRLPSGELVHRDAAIGPYSSLPFALRGWDGCAGGAASPYRCLNAPPDPLHKDVYLEIDWEDGQRPDVAGLGQVVDMFDGAPVANPDGTGGVRLHVLVDEGCGGSFGTPAQRRDAAVVEARALAVRYATSGDPTCPAAPAAEAVRRGLGLAPLDAGTWTPFGSAEIGGDEIEVTLGPLWTCPGDTAPCLRQPVGGSAPLVTPGTFPADVHRPSGGLAHVAWPAGRLLGERDSDAATQLWGRAVAHLLGHALGLADEADVGNDPAPTGRHQAADHQPLLPLGPESYATWSGLAYAPGDGTVLAPEPVIDHDALAAGDPDGDGVAEGVDVCPGVHDPDQADGDASPAWATAARTGDACDPVVDATGPCPCPLDADGDLVDDQVETALGSDPADGSSTPEAPGEGDACSDGDDDDGDGHVDQADPGCTARPRPVTVDHVELDAVGALVTGTEVSWSSGTGGPFTVRTGGTGCADGTVVDSGTYDPGTGAGPAHAFTFVPTGALAEGTDVVRVCVGDRSAAVPLVVDRERPRTMVAAGPADGGVTGSTVTFGLASTEAPVAYLCAMDDARLRRCGATVTFTGLATGPHTFRATAYDVAGNPDDISVVLSFFVGNPTAFLGFRPPVDGPPVVNRTAAGRAVPVKFAVGGSGPDGLPLFAAGYPSSARMDCVTGAVLDTVEETATPGSTGLTYDPGTGTYQYVWQTARPWAGSCRVLILRFRDGTEARAWFRLT
jgi:hypothetical protein